jgi:hypothetical protein
LPSERKGLNTLRKKVGFLDRDPRGDGSHWDGESSPKKFVSEIKTPFGRATGA